MKLTHIINAFVVLLICVALAQAQSDRTFVSAHGTDNSDCGSLDLPCRSFNTALFKTNAGGEVIALDSGIYDTFNISISQSVTLTAAPGAHVELSNNDNSNNRITVSAAAGDRVVLRNLYLSRQPGTGSGAFGIGVLRVGVLQVENCVIDGFTRGIEFLATGKVYVVDTVVRNSSVGIDLFPNSGTVIAAIERCRFEKNGDGLAVEAFGGTIVKASVKDSFTTGQVSVGFRADAGTGATAELNIENCLSANNDTGIFSFTNVGTATVRVSNTTVTDNTSFGVRATLSGQLLTRGNNTVEGNGTNGTFTGTFTAK